MTIIEDRVSEAEALVQHGRYDEAIGAFQEAIADALDQAALDRAAHCYTRLSWAAWQSGHSDQAAAFGEEGVVRLAEAAPSPELTRLYQEAARVQSYTGNMPRARLLAKRALELARELDLRDVQAEALNTLSMSSWGVEPPDTIIAMSREAVALSDHVGTEMTAGRAHNNLGSALGPRMGRFKEAQGHFGRCIELNRRLDFKVGMLFGMANAANTSLFLGDLAEARRQLQSMKDLQQSLESISVASFLVRVNEGRLLRQEGRLEDAYTWFMTLYHDAHQSQDSQQTGEALSWLADLAYEMGRLDDILPDLEASPDELYNPVYSIMMRAYQAIAYAQQGRTDDMEAALDRADALTHSIPGTWAELWLRLATARITLMQGNADRALTQYETLTGEFMLREMRWHRAHLRFERAEAALAANRSGQAVYQLHEAVSEFERLGVACYVEQAQARLAVLE